MNVLKQKFLTLLVGAAVALTGYASTVSADAFEGLSMMRMGQWEVDFSGNVNSFVVTGDCDPSGVGGVAGGLACGSNGQDYDYGDIRTGLLPSWFNFQAFAPETAGGWKTAIHISFQPGGDDGDSLAGGALGGPLGLNTSNFRQIFTTLSHDDVGTFKIGRDLGVFASDAILEDMTLLGVGGTARDRAGGGNTTLGRIGFGYIYADWKSQAQYTTPNLNGFTATVAMTDPWAATSLAGNYREAREGEPWNDIPAIPAIPYSATNGGGNNQEDDTYGAEAKLNYSMGDIGRVWTSYIRQDVDWDTGALDDGEGEGYDVGAKLTVGAIDLVGYYYDGEGIGTTTFLTDGFDRFGNERDSDGYYVQGRWKTPMGTTLGVSYGESDLDETSEERAAAGGSTNLVETNEMLTVGAYHPIGEGFNLVLEYSRIESEAHNGTDAEEDSVAVGAIMFF